MEKPLPYDDLFALRQAMIEDAPVLGRIDEGPSSDTALDLSKLGAAGTVDSAPFQSPVTDFYATNPVARASRTMAECSKARGNVSQAAAE